MLVLKRTRQETAVTTTYSDRLALALLVAAPLCWGVLALAPPPTLAPFAGFGDPYGRSQGNMIDVYLDDSVSLFHGTP